MQQFPAQTSSKHVDVQMLRSLSVPSTTLSPVLSVGVQFFVREHHLTLVLKLVDARGKREKVLE